MRLRLAWDQQGGSTTEWIGVGGVAAGLVAAVVLAAPTVGPPVRDAIEVLVCRAASPVTGQACAELDGAPGDAGDAPGVKGPPPGGEIAGGPRPFQPQEPPLDQCVTYVEEAVNQQTVELLPLPFAGARGSYTYVAVTQQRGDGMWEVTPTWYADAGLMGGVLDDNAFAALYGQDGQTFVVPDQAAAEAIEDARRAQPYRHIPGANVLAPGLDLVDGALGVFGLGGEDPGPPQREVLDAGATQGFQMDTDVVPGWLGFEMDHQHWYGGQAVIDEAAGTITHNVTLSGEFNGSAELAYPGNASSALGSALVGGVPAGGDAAVTMGLVQDQDTGAFTHLEVTYVIQSELGASIGAEGDGSRGSVGVDVEADANITGGQRTVVTGRLPLEDLSPADRERVTAWMQGLVSADSPDDVAALEQEDLAELFDSSENATITRQQYETDGSEYGLDVQIGDPVLGALGGAVEPGNQNTTHTLTDAQYWAPGVGWQDWEGCGA